MTTTLIAGVLAGTALICAARPSVAQDKGKTEAAELARASQAALQQLYASVPLAKELGPKAHAILVFPKVTKAGLGIGGQYGEGALLKGGTRGWLLQDDRRFVRVAGGRPAVRLRDALHEREGARATGRCEGFRGRCWPERRPGGRGHGEDHHDQYAEGRYLRLRLRTEGADGGPRDTRQQDHQDHAQVG